MIYLDTSVALASLLAENKQPHPTLWQEPLVSSRLIEYELWNRLHHYKLTEQQGEAARRLLARLSIVELTQTTLKRALEAFPVIVRTLDAIHLAAMDFLRQHQQEIQLASYDERFIAAARALNFSIVEI